MAKVTPIQNDFNAGELSPRLYGRSDLVVYSKGVEELKNFLIKPQGGAFRRPGTKFIGEVKDSSQAARLIPFEFSTTDRYILEFNGGKISFYRSGARVLESNKTVSGATQANPVVITATAHGFSNGDRVFLSGVGGMVEINNRTFTIANVTTNTFELSGINGSAYTAYTSGGTAARVYAITQPYAAADLSKIQYAQDADTMYLVHPSYEIRKLTRTGHTSWTLTTMQPYDFTGGAFQDDNTTAITMTPSATTGAITVTASAAFFTANMVNGILRIGTGNGYVKITAFNSSTSVNATVIQTLSGVSATTNWAIGAWMTEYGFPRAVTFWEQRLWFAGTTAQPQTTWGSKTNEYENFTKGANAADAVVYTIAAEKVNAILWLSSKKVLALGTSGGIWSISTGATQEALTPTNATAKPETSYGAEGIIPQHIGNYTYFVQRGLLKVRELLFNVDVDAYKAEDMTIFADHITGTTGLTEMAYQQLPDDLLWCVRADGKLAVMTRVPSHEVLGWDTQDTDGSFENIAVIPAGTYDEVWVIVKRTINAQTKRYVEVFAAETFSTVADAFFVDSGLTYSGAAATTIVGLDHLEGKTVSVLAGGATHPTKTVTSGKITLDRSATKVQVGLKSTPRLVTLRPDVGALAGSGLNQPKRHARQFVLLYNSVGMKIGDKDSQDIVPFRSGSDQMDQPVPLFTGFKEMIGDGGWHTDAQIVITTDDPLPLNVLAIITETETNIF